MHRIRIQHSTCYTYARRVRFTPHRLVIRPREGHDQRILSMELRIEPAHDLTWVRDIFGNSIALVDVTESASILEIDSDVLVERSAPFPTRELHDPVRVPFPVTYEPIEAGVVTAYVNSSFVEDADAVHDWVQQHVNVDATDAEGTVQSMCESINKTIAYLRRKEKGVQSPQETLQLVSGSCRDMATLMMEAVRSLGLAARFASGYLHGTASLAGQASTHAWTEVYLPRLGWRGFDPTLGKPASTQHIVTGVSNHPRGVMPISGGFIGASNDFQSLVVQVKTWDVT
jgi:transglutaminase-like putative cysteine protease